MYFLYSVAQYFWWQNECTFVYTHAGFLFCLSPTNDNDSDNIMMLVCATLYELGLHNYIALLTRAWNKKENEIHHCT